MDVLVEQAEAAMRQLEGLRQSIAFKNKRIQDCDASLVVLRERNEIIELAKGFYKKAIDMFYKESVGELEELINDVLAAIFYDSNYRIRMEMTDSRSKSMTWYIIDGDRGFEMPVKNGVGRGIRAVVSFVLQSYYVLRSGSKYMFIDEGYHYISEAYVGTFFEFAKVLCQEKGLALTMISHDDRFLSYADKIYRVVEGEISQSTLEEAATLHGEASTDEQ